ncbi:MAG: pantoate--beta-alanine ligase [Rickettsiales bacterium]|nr:pantoate--beta-alanine ligase [Rickettsiales bacterium]
MQISIAQDLAGYQSALTELARLGKRIALVPTMGALHEGHASLVRIARQHADAVAVSVFVNPKQFGVNEDFDKYPRTLESDIHTLREAGVSLVYAPPIQDIYPEGYATTVSVSGLDSILCGASRPGHFNGVATVVTKLLLRTLPHVAIFGEKDYQQLCIIRRLVTDLDMPIQIIGAPIMREDDGLALSSRNRYLTPEERAIAPTLYRTLTAMAARLENGEALAAVLEDGKKQITAAGFKLDYLDARAEGTLAALDTLNGPARLLVAAWLGKTRLIDNITVGTHG